MTSGLTRFTAGAVGVCGVLAGVEVAQAFGAGVPHALELVCGSAAAVLAATVALRNVAFVWRGPVILPFPRDEAVLCDAREAAAVRAAAQLRGSMGGAGYLHPRRLAASATAWGAISLQSLALLPPQPRTAGTFLPLAVAVAAMGVAAIFPADPFFYREAGGGCVLAFPSEVCRRLLDAAGVESALAPVAVGLLGATQGAGTSRPDASRGESGSADTPRPDPRSAV